MGPKNYQAIKIQHGGTQLGSAVRETVFGLEDGMVSTLGAITGIAAGTGETAMVLLAGLVIIVVESISMGTGSYLASRSERSVAEGKLREEQREIKQFPAEERQELRGLYEADGWPPELAAQMAQTASQKPSLFLREMALRELKIFPEELANPWKNGLIMGLSYIIGGCVPLLPYLFLGNLQSAIPVSATLALTGLFALGAGTAKITRRPRFWAGLEMLAFGAAASLAGYAAGGLAKSLLG